MLAGSNGSGLSSANDSIAGNAELGGGFSDFAGDIAIVRFYRNQVLTAGEFEDNFNALVPEPSTSVLAALGLFGVAYLARRRK